MGFFNPSRQGDFWRVEQSGFFNPHIGGDTPLPPIEPDGNLLSKDFNWWTQGCWNASGLAVPSIAGSAAFRVRPAQGIVPVPPMSRLMFRTNSPWIFVCRIVDADGIITRNPAQIHGSQEGVEIQLEPNEVGVAISLSNLPASEAGTTTAVWEERFNSGTVLPEIYVID